MIAVNQDPLGIQGLRLKYEKKIEVKMNEFEVVDEMTKFVFQFFSH